MAFQEYYRQTGVADLKVPLGKLALRWVDINGDVYNDVYVCQWRILSEEEANMAFYQSREMMPMVFQRHFGGGVKIWLR